MGRNTVVCRVTILRVSRSLLSRAFSGFLNSGTANARPLPLAPFTDLHFVLVTSFSSSNGFHPPRCNILQLSLTNAPHRVQVHARVTLSHRSQPRFRDPFCLFVSSALFAKSHDNARRQDHIRAL